MEFADNYLMIGLLAGIVVLIVFIIWYHTRKTETPRVYPGLQHQAPPPSKDVSAFLSYSLHDFKGINYVLETDVRQIVKKFNKDLSQANDLIRQKENQIKTLSLVAPPRKPVVIAPDQFRFHCKPPMKWCDKQYKRYVYIKRKYLAMLPDKGFGGELDYFCMDCGHNDKLKNFSFSESCPHCHSFRIKAVPYL